MWRIQKGARMEGTEVYVLEMSQSKAPFRGLSPRTVTELLNSGAATKWNDRWKLYILVMRVFLFRSQWPYTNDAALLKWSSPLGSDTRLFELPCLCWPCTLWSPPVSYLADLLMWNIIFMAEAEQRKECTAYSVVNIQLQQHVKHKTRKKLNTEHWNTEYCKLACAGCMNMINTMLCLYTAK